MFFEREKKTAPGRGNKKVTMSSKHYLGAGGDSEYKRVAEGLRGNNGRRIDV